jgi:hypothetical protein
LTLKHIVDKYIQLVPDAKAYCDQCLSSSRWDGNVVLMMVDAAFTSIGMDYFHVVIPGLQRFKEECIDTGKIRSVNDLPEYNSEQLIRIWRNRRSWSVAKSIASILIHIKQENNVDDIEAFKLWAHTVDLQKWRDNPVAKVNGVGINTFQYLRIMAGVDTVMPDRIVKRVIGKIMSEANIEMPSTDMEFVYKVEDIALTTGYKAVELCWMTWLIKDRKLISEIS